MKTLTYGTLPNFDEFEKAFTAANLTDNRYLMELNMRDADMLYSVGLRSDSQQSSAGWTTEGKLQLLYTAQQLHTTIQALARIADLCDGEYGECETCNGSGYVWVDDGKRSTMRDCPDDNCNAFGQMDDSSIREWAGDFASSILFTLGFEWV